MIDFTVIIIQMRTFIFSLVFATNAFSNIENFTLDNVKTLYIVDGDSVSMQMRLAGIDTPETTQSCQKKQGKTLDCGRLAKGYLKKLLAKTSGKIHIKPIAIGHYKRILVRLYKGDININKTMVVSGMAYALGDTYQIEQAIAKKKKLGFWGFYQPPITPKKYRKTNSYKRKR